jgi:hypothetical protein
VVAKRERTICKVDLGQYSKKRSAIVDSTLGLNTNKCVRQQRPMFTNKRRKPFGALDTNLATEESLCKVYIPNHYRAVWQAMLKYRTGSSLVMS